MAGRESRKYSSTIESSLYVGSVLKVVLDHPRFKLPEAERPSNRAAFIQAVMSSLGPQIVPLALPTVCP